MRKWELTGKEAPAPFKVNINMLRLRPTYISPDLLSSLSDSSTIMDQAGGSSIGIKRKASAEPSPTPDLKNPHLDVPIEAGFEAVPFQEKVSYHLPWKCSR